MTIFNYDNLPVILIPYILREVGNPAICVWVTNQETKEKVFCDAVTIGELKSFFNNVVFTFTLATKSVMFTEKYPL